MEFNCIDLKRPYQGITNYMFVIYKDAKQIGLFKNFTSTADIHFYFKQLGLLPSQINSKTFSFIHSGREVDINKIPKKYKKFKIV